ncbi:MAG: alpha/beta hydrolase [Chitinophagales bacterium]|nr:alpha/beta hydrolase [Chitinophagales bacterium]
MEKIFYYQEEKINYALHQQAPKRPWIVLIHGFCSDHLVWDACVPILRQHYNLLLPDLAGYGKSDMTTERWTIESMADRIAALLQHESIERCIILGHSMGGYVSITFADLYPQMVAGLLLCHTTTFDDDEQKKQNRRKAVQLIEKFGTRPFLTVFYDDLFLKEYARQNNEVVNEQENRALQLPAKIIIDSSNAMIARPSRAGVLERLTCPVGWLIGKQDNFTTYEKNLAEIYLPQQSCVYVMSNCGHMSMWEDTQKATNYMLDFADLVFRTDPLTLPKS